MRKTTLKLASVFFLVLAFGPGFGLTLFQDSFDSQSSVLESWKESKTAMVTKYTGTYKIGTASMQIKSTNNSATYINTSPFTNMTLSFKLAGIGIAAGTFVEAYYNNAGIDVLCGRISNTTADGNFRSFTVSIPKGNNPLKLLFKVTSTATTAYGYVDDVNLTGIRK